MRFANAMMSLVSFAVMAGCTVESLPEEEFVETLDEALITENALTSNALTSNALTSNALTSNALTSNALTSNALTSNALAAIQAPNEQGALNREIMRYIVACAFKSTQSFDFTWKDKNNVPHAEHYVGQLGLAPQWRTGKINLNGQRMVTACLAAKTNYYGKHVTLSVRSGESPLRLHHHDDELDEFSKVEGAFWGNLWAPKPYINACYNSKNVDNSRDHARDCAVGHELSDGTIEECGIINIVGSCSSVCKKYNSSRGYYEDCRDQPGVSFKRTDLVITTALP